MARNERRRGMPLDEAYYYFRKLELKLERPALFKVCNALKTVDFVVESDEVPGFRALSREAWSQIRDSLFRVLITSFPGYFLIYEDGNYTALEAGHHWPTHGHLEFYPERILRRFETYKSRLENLDEDVVTVLRWSWSQDKQNVTPVNFKNLQMEEATQAQEDQSEASRAVAFLERMYEICEEEASEGKKHAHRKWCQLYWEANGCSDKRQRNELLKEMGDLQSVWGRPAQVV